MSNAAPGGPVPPDSLQALLSEAVIRYENDVGQAIRNDLQWKEIASCTTADQIYGVLEAREKSFKTFRKSGERIRSFLQPIVSIVEVANEVVGEAAGNVVPGGKAVFVAVAILFKAAKGVSAAYDAIESLFSQFRETLDRMKVHVEDARDKRGDRLNKILVDILVHLLHTFALATKYLEGGPSKDPVVGWLQTRTISKRIRHYIRNLIGDVKIQEALTRLGGLTEQELKSAVADARAAAFRVENTVAQMQKLQINAEIKAWLSAPDPTVNHGTFYEKRQSERLPEWFFNRRFDEWRGSEKGIYWIHGKPGSGKSVLFTSIIDILDAKEPLFAFFYYDFRDTHKQNARDTLASLILQFGMRSEALRQRLVDFHASHNHFGGQANESTLLKCLRDLLVGSTNVCIALDALDEWPDSESSGPRETVLPSLLQNLRSLGACGARLLLTSRPEQDIRSFMAPESPIELSLHEAAEQRRAIREHIDKVFSSGLGYHDWSVDTKRQLSEQLVAQSNGMFILVDLQLKRLHKARPSDIENILKTLPRTLDGMYERILAGIPLALASYAHRMFQCIIYAKRPLSLAELAEVFAIDFDADTDAVLHPDRRPGDPQARVFEACSSFIQISVDNTSVQFIHLSAQDYLLSHLTGDVEHYHVEESESHVILSKLCLGTLLFGPSPTPQPLLDYAVRYWGAHVSSKLIEDAVSTALRRFLHPSSSAFMYWQTTWRSPGVYTSKETFEPFFASAYFGLAQHTEYLLAVSAQETAILSNGYALLCGAAYGGRGDICRLLIEQNIAVKHRDLNGVTALHYALASENFDIAELLVKHGACVDDQTSDGRTALHDAADRLEISTCEWLISNGASVHSRTNDGRTALHIAVERERQTSSLLSRMFGYSNRHGSPYRGKPFTVILRALLARGTSVHAWINEGVTPLHIVEQYGRTGPHLLFELLKCGAIIGVQDSLGRTLLHLDAAHGHGHVIEKLLAKNARLDIRSSRSAILLHWAIYGGHAKVIELLLDYEPHLVTRHDADGFTLLAYASALGYPATVRVLLARGASPYTGESLYGTPLELAKRAAKADVLHCGSVSSEQAQQGPVGRSRSQWMELKLPRRDRAEVVRLLEEQPRTCPTTVLLRRTRKVKSVEFW